MIYNQLEQVLNRNLLCNDKLALLYSYEYSSVKEFFIKYGIQIGELKTKIKIPSLDNENESFNLMFAKNENHYWYLSNIFLWAYFNEDFLEDIGRLKIYNSALFLWFGFLGLSLSENGFVRYKLKKNFSYREIVNLIKEKESRSRKDVIKKQYQVYLSLINTRRDLEFNVDKEGYLMNKYQIFKGVFFLSPDFTDYFLRNLRNLFFDKETILWNKEELNSYLKARLNEICSLRIPIVELHWEREDKYSIKWQCKEFLSEVERNFLDLYSGDLK